MRFEKSKAGQMKKKKRMKKALIAHHTVSGILELLRASAKTFGNSTVKFQSIHGLLNPEIAEMNILVFSRK